MTKRVTENGFGLVTVQVTMLVSSNVFVYRNPRPPFLGFEIVSNHGCTRIHGWIIQGFDEKRPRPQSNKQFGKEENI